MSRAFSFDLAFQRQPLSGPALRVTTKPEHSAAQLAPDVPAGSILPGLAVFSAIDGTSVPGPAEVLGERELVFRLPPLTGGTPWRVAVLVNLIDNAVFGSDDPAISQLIESVTIESDGLAGATAETLFRALEARKEEARQEMTATLPAEFVTHPDLGREWPADGTEWMFEIQAFPEKPLSDAQQTECRELIEQIDALLAWTAFETEKSPAEILASGSVPYPVEIEVTADTLTYQLEMPPSGIALPLVLLREAVEKRFSTKVVKWNVGISEGW